VVVGATAVILGSLAALAAVLANPLGIGHGGFGWRQFLLLSVGIIVTSGGAVAVLRPSSVQPDNLTERFRAALRSGRSLWPFAIVAIVFVGLRLYAFIDVHPYRWPDTAGYELCGTRPLWNWDFYACKRGWTLPLYYKFVTGDDLRIVGQFILACVSWTYLAATVARTLDRTRLRLVAFGAVLLFSVTSTITLWDGILLSESLSLSLAAVVVGAWISFVRAESWTSLVLVIAATVLWSFLRDSTALLVLLTVPFIVIWLTRTRVFLPILRTPPTNVGLFRCATLSGNAYFQIGRHSSLSKMPECR
jgi:hypothetical protein